MSLPYPLKSSGPAFLTQCACFACRKSFKKDLSDPRYAPVCPECKKPLTDMGRYFRAPRKADGDQWKKVEILYRAGVYFAGTQSPSLGKFPDSVREAKEFIAKNRAALLQSGRQRDTWRATAIAELEKKEAKRREARLKVKTKKAPNKAPEPTPRLVTIRAEPRIAPSRVVAHL